MHKIIYEFEIIQNEIHRAWEFDSAEARNSFYADFVRHFSGKEFKNKDQAKYSPNFIQVTVSNVYPDSHHEMADIVPEELYDGALLEEMLEYANSKY